jgi:autotransporter-associated beta strand protein
MDSYDEVRYGNNLTRTETLNTPGAFGPTMQSGFYECNGVQDNPTQWPTGATGWWHLNVTRHSNGGNNYAMQVAGSFFNQELWYRKVNNSGTTAWTKFKASDDFYSNRANLLMTGGGTITHTAAGELKWTERIIILGGGRGSPAGITSQVGYYDINMPAVGTVIAGLGGTASQTVTAGGIPIGLWHALYYKLNPNANAATVNSNFFLVNYSAPISITDDMVLLAVSNSDPNGNYSSFVKLGTGQVLFRNNSTYRGGTPVSVTNYSTSALAIADTTLPVGANYTVNVGGSKQLYVK